MMTIEDYLAQNGGFTVDDLDSVELEEVRKEVEIINAGGFVLDGVLARKIVPDYAKMILDEK